MNNVFEVFINVESGIKKQSDLEKVTAVINNLELTGRVFLPKGTKQLIAKESLKVALELDMPIAAAVGDEVELYRAKTSFAKGQIVTVVGNNAGRDSLSHTLFGL